MLLNRINFVKILVDDFIIVLLVCQVNKCTGCDIYRGVKSKRAKGGNPRFPPLHTPITMSHISFIGELTFFRFNKGECLH